MKLLQDLYTLSEAKKEGLSKLPNEVMTAIKKNIRKGAEDVEQRWANALELVHRAYEVEGVQRPTPDMEGAWKQYEENITYAVRQLAEHRGLTDEDEETADWRMSSAMFHEAMREQVPFHVRAIGRNVNDSYIVEAQSLSDVVSIFENEEFDIHVRGSTPTSATLTFSRWGIRKNLRIIIEQMSERNAVNQVVRTLKPKMVGLSEWDPDIMEEVEEMVYSELEQMGFGDDSDQMLRIVSDIMSQLFPDAYAQYR